jgi:hypothetical protein
MPSNSADGANWSAVKDQLKALPRDSLIALARDLYRASSENRRFLHARLLGPAIEIAKYRELVREAIYPDALSRRPVRLGEAQRLVRHYRQATGDLSGTLDLLLTFIEAGTEQAADLGYGDERYFVALERALDEAVEIGHTLSGPVHRAFVDRARTLADRASAVGWGFGDYVAEAAAGLA